jgi:two-component system, OmpR family, sensor kinase
VSPAVFTKSIRWRLQLWLAALLVCVLTGFAATIYQLQRISQLREIDEELERRVAVLSGAVRGGPPRPGFGPPRFESRPEPHKFDKDRPPPPPPRGHPDQPPFRGERKGPFGPRDFEISPEIASLFDPTGTKAFYFTVWSRDGALFKRSNNAPPDVPLPERLDRTDTRTHTRTRDGYREAFHFTELADCVLAGRSISADLDALRRFKWWLLAAGGMVLAFALGGGWWLTSRAIRPIEDISGAASRISAGNLSERINVAETDSELGRLASVLNSTFTRLEAAFAQQKQFTADASHELRTPLAVIIAEAQTTLARERTVAEYRESIAICLDAAQQMRRLTESLLQLARFDAGQEEPIRRSAVDLVESARVCVARIGPLAEERGIKIHCDLAPAHTFGDADRLGQLVTNLLTNAIYYNKPSGEIRVSTRSENGGAVLAVADSGEGIAVEDLPHVFERFYRADKSRSRAEGRSGLGLAICKAIVDSHGGSIDVTSRPGAGTTFTVRLPALAAG